MRRIFPILFLTLSLIGIATLCARQIMASETDDLEKQARLMNKIAEQEGQNEKVYNSLSEQLGVDVATLKTQQQTYKAGFGNLFIANALAKSVTTTTNPVLAETLLQQFRDGKGWGAIANQYGTKLGPVVSQLRRSNQAMENARNQSREEKNASEGNKNKDRNERTESRSQQERSRPSPSQGHGATGRSGR